MILMNSNPYWWILQSRKRKVVRHIEMNGSSQGLGKYNNFSKCTDVARSMAKAVTFLNASTRLG